MYKFSKKSATVIIHLSYDCGNKCPFCDIKKEDMDASRLNFIKIKESMNKMDKINPKCDFVISGGEPLANLDGLEEILYTIRSFNLMGSRHKVYIDTTLPLTKQGILRLNKLSHIITCLNISRHINEYMYETNDILISLLQIPVRINCVLYTDEEALYAREIINRFRKIKNVIGIQFRDDYRDVGYDNLYNCNWNKKLNNLLEGLDKNINDCEFNFDSFKWDCTITYGPIVTFHRTMRQTKIVYANIVDENGKSIEDLVEVNSIIISPEGEVLDDWNGKPLDLEKYKKEISR